MISKEEEAERRLNADLLSSIVEDVKGEEGYKMFEREFDLYLHGHLTLSEIMQRTLSRN